MKSRSKNEEKYRVTKFEKIMKKHEKNKLRNRNYSMDGKMRKKSIPVNSNLSNSDILMPKKNQKSLQNLLS